MSVWCWQTWLGAWKGCGAGTGYAIGPDVLATRSMACVLLVAAFTYVDQCEGAFWPCTCEATQYNELSCAIPARRVAALRSPRATHTCAAHAHACTHMQSRANHIRVGFCRTLNALTRFGKGSQPCIAAALYSWLLRAPGSPVRTNGECKGAIKPCSKHALQATALKICSIRN